MCAAGAPVWVHHRAGDGVVEAHTLDKFSLRIPDHGWVEVNGGRLFWQQCFFVGTVLCVGAGAGAEVLEFTSCQTSCIRSHAISHKIQSCINLALHLIWRTDRFSRGCLAAQQAGCFVLEVSSEVLGSVDSLESE